MSMYVKSKSKTGKVPRTGNQYLGSYYDINFPKDGGHERVFILSGYKIRNGKHIKDFAVFNSQAAAKRAGWVKVG